MSEQSALLGGGLAEPGEALVQAVASQGTSTLNVPFSSPKGVKSQLLHHFGHAHHAHVLFVGEHQQYCILELILSEHLLELLSSYLDSFFIRGVDNVDEGLSVLVVVFPELPNLVLASHIPHSELDLLEFDGLDVEADGGN